MKKKKKRGGIYLKILVIREPNLSFADKDRGPGSGVSQVSRRPF